MLIKVKTPNSNQETLEIEVSDTDNFLTVKQKIIQKWHHADIDTIKVIFAGALIKNDKLVKDLNLENNSTIFCVIPKKKEITNNSQQSEITNNLQQSVITNNLQPNSDQQQTEIPSNIPDFNMDLYNQVLQNPQMMQMMQQMMQDPNLRNQAISNYLQSMGLQNNSEMQEMMSQMMNSFYSNPESMQMVNNFFQMPNQTQNQGSEEEYKEQLEILNGLGFTNLNQNIQVLKMCNGNIDQAADILFSSFDG